MVGTSQLPSNGKAFQLHGRVGFFLLVEGVRCTADDALLAFPDLSKNCAEACSRRDCIETERQAEVREGGDGAGGEERFEAVEGALALGAPVEESHFPVKTSGRRWRGHCRGQRGLD